MSKKLNLGFFLNLGSSFRQLQKSGQDSRLINIYLKKYVQSFVKIFVFTYAQEVKSLPAHCQLLVNRRRWHRFLYQFACPFFYREKIKKINVFRVNQLLGVMPAIMTRLFFNKPFVFTYGYDYYAFARLKRQPGRAQLIKIYERLAMRFASSVIVTTKNNQRQLRQKHPQQKIFYLPNGVDVKRFKPSFRQLLDLNKKRKIKLLFVGRLEPQKNLESLVKAVSLLSNKEKIYLTLVGQGSLKWQLKRLAQKNKVNFKIIDKVPHFKLVTYYQEADIFCLPSFQEGQPKVLLEAMACGLCCLVAKYQGAIEFKNKVFLTGFKASEIAKNLSCLIKDFKLRKKLASVAREEIVKKFNLDQLIQKEIKIFKNAV